MTKQTKQSIFDCSYLAYLKALKYNKPMYSYRYSAYVDLMKQFNIYDEFQRKYL